jgi:hypothetical protein
LKKYTSRYHSAIFLCLFNQTPEQESVPKSS